MQPHVPMWAWAGFAALMLGLITFDLLIHRRHAVDSRRRAIGWSVFWIAIALVFNGVIALCLGRDAGSEFLTAYLMEKSLSVDNLFVFLLLFAALGIPPAEQRRVLTWGIFGALIMRAGFIAAGVALFATWHWVTYVFGALLILTALKMLRPEKPTDGPPGGRVIAWLRRVMPISQQLDGSRFFTWEGARRVATPLLLALIAVEAVDVLFAVDSIPAGFAVTENPFILYSSNVFAVLGLRSIYVVLAGALQDLKYLRHGLAGVLAIAGAKMLLSGWLHVPPLASLGAIVVCLGSAVWLSLRARRGRPTLPAVRYDART